MKSKLESNLTVKISKNNHSTLRAMKYCGYLAEDKKVQMDGIVDDALTFYFKMLKQKKSGRADGSLKP